MLLLVVAGSAQAGPSESKAKRLADKGFKAYDEGDYEEAIAYFEEANELAPADGLLYNIAQAYRQLGSEGCAKALEYYRRYRARAYQRRIARSQAIEDADLRD